MTLGSRCRVPTSAASPISTSCQVKQKDGYCEMVTRSSWDSVTHSIWTTVPPPKKNLNLNLKVSLLCFTFIYTSMYLFLIGLFWTFSSFLFLSKIYNNDKMVCMWTYLDLEPGVLRTKTDVTGCDQVNTCHREEHIHSTPQHIFSGNTPANPALK